jgi:PEP-CTERM motif
MIMRNNSGMRLAWLLATVVAATGVSASAAVIDLTFEGIAPYPNGNNVSILDYYNGGTSSVGTSGTDYGISFPSNALVICLNTLGTGCSNSSRGDQGDPDSQLGGMYFLEGSNTFLNDPAGFDTGFSFYYTDPYEPGGSVSVYSDLDGGGTLLATLDLPTTPVSCDGAYGASYCPFVPVGLSFVGTAKSISFAGTADYIVFDDITFGSVIPGNGDVPEPASVALMGTGLVALLFGARRRSRRQRQTA